MKCTECPEYDVCRLQYDLRKKRKSCEKAKKEIKTETADEMLLALGFRKNTSVCYGEDKGTLLYEKPVMGDTDCLQIYFNKPEVCFYNLMHRSIWMQYGLVNAIQKKMEEMGWDNELY